MGRKWEIGGRGKSRRKKETAEGAASSPTRAPCRLGETLGRFGATRGGAKRLNKCY